MDCLSSEAELVRILTIIIIVYRVLLNEIKRLQNFVKLLLVIKICIDDT